MNQNINKVDNILKDKNKYIVLINSKEYVFSEDVIVKFLIFKDKEFTDKELKQIIDYNNSDQLFNKTLHFISFCQRTTHEVNKYLKENKATKKQINEIIKRLNDLEYLNDQKYANDLVDYSIRSFKGPLKVKDKLFQKGVKDEVINKVLEEYTKEIEEELIKQYFEKNIDKFNDEPIIRQKTKHLEKLQRDGFTLDVIYRVLALITFNDNSDQKLEKEIERLRFKYRDLSDSEMKNKIISSLISKGYEYSNINKKL